MIGQNIAMNPESCLIALRQCASLLEQKADADKQLADLNQKFKAKGIEETLSIAKTLLFPKEDPNAIRKKRPDSARYQGYFNICPQRGVFRQTTNHIFEHFDTVLQKYISETYQALVSKRGSFAKRYLQ